jgi:hypothetical protein
MGVNALFIDRKKTEVGFDGIEHMPAVSPNVTEQAIQTNTFKYF